MKKCEGTGRFSIGTRRMRHFFWVICMAVFIYALLPLDYLPTRELSLNWIDKIQHFIVFGGLCVIGSKGYLERPYSLMLGLLVFGGVIEIAQFATGWRHMDFGDFVADAVGIMIGRIAFHLLQKRKPNLN